ncbi:MAG: hypothetical protein IT342_00995 [Candidatus Melainabacteria bacterium]|nr:hypothetical protein [Candidatus Melainabacteria bacterium]
MQTQVKTKEKEIVLKAVDSLGRRVTAADVAAKTGLPVLVAQEELNRVAAETGGHMEVATTGDVAYKFSPGFQNAYLTKGIARFFQVAGKKFFDIAYFLLRISFGIMLILSVLAVLLIFIAIMLYGNKGGNNDRDNYGGGFHFGFFDYLILRDLLTWGAYSAAGQPGNQQQRQRKSNFLFDCFSFLFGDGNPNADIEEKKWSLIANSIRDHGGVVTAEQLAPYTGANPTDDDAVLPVLVRFNGKPEVTEEGGIVYAFPSMQVSATARDSHASAPFLKEMRWPFVGPQAGSLIMVYVLAGFNFLGTWWLFLQPGLHELWPLLLPLVTYGTLFVTIPIGRKFALDVINQRITERNGKRSTYAEMLKAPAPELSKKLSHANNLRIGRHDIKAEEIVYTTEASNLEQESADQLIEFDKKLKEGADKGEFDATP